jgi:hypothetical protein
MTDLPFWRVAIAKYVQLSLRIFVSPSTLVGAVSAKFFSFSDADPCNLVQRSICMSPLGCLPISRWFLQDYPMQGAEGAWSRGCSRPRRTKWLFYIRGNARAAVISVTTFPATCLIYLFAPIGFLDSAVLRVEARQYQKERLNLEDLDGLFRVQREHSYRDNRCS